MSASIFRVQKWAKQEISVKLVGKQSRLLPDLLFALEDEGDIFLRNLV
jgi:hypothetical protein